MKIIVSLMLVLFTGGLALAQPATPPQGQQMTCEQQLEETRGALVQLRKDKARSDFQSASVEEAAVALQKRVAELEAKSKAAAVEPKKDAKETKK